MINFSTAIPHFWMHSFTFAVLSSGRGREGVVVTLDCPANLKPGPFSSKGVLWTGSHFKMKNKNNYETYISTT